MVQFVFTVGNAPRVYSAVHQLNCWLKVRQPQSWKFYRGESLNCYKLNRYKSFEREAEDVESLAMKASVIVQNFTVCTKNQL